MTGLQTTVPLEEEFKTLVQTVINLIDDCDKLIDRIEALEQIVLGDRP